MKAWVHRRGRKSWLFEYSDIYDELIHKTSRGIVYAILQDCQIGKPFWIGRRFLVGCWASWEAELRAYSIEFEGAGEYLF